MIKLIAEAAGAGGAILVILAFLLTGPRRILKLSLSSSLLWIVHFGLLADWAGLIVSIASALRNGAGAFLPRRSMIVLSWLSSAVVLAFILIFDPGHAILAVAAPARAVSNHLRDREIPFRLACSVSALSYIAYGISIHSPVAISSAITLAVVLGTPFVRSHQARRRAKPV